jgi:Uncharacterized protein conserved in bacteria
MDYRVDNIPWPVRPLYLLLTGICGLLFYFYCWICRATSQFSIEGPGNHDLSQHAIFCMWHEAWWSYFPVFFRYPSALAVISHPAAYMKPMHNLFHLLGLRRLLLGSSGEEGRRAANEIARLVQNGFSTTISPDGPTGPPRNFKKGVLHIALQSGVPIVPLTISASRSVTLPSWDSKRLPLPFGHIKVIVHEPLRVTRENFSEARYRIVTALEGPR